MMVNINGLPIIPTFFMSLFVIFSLLVYSLLFDRNKVIYFCMLIQINMLIYMATFYLLVNSTSDYVVILLGRVLYISFALLSVTSIFAISHMSQEPYWKTKIYVIVSVIILFVLTAFFDGPIVTTEVAFTTYYSPIKGPLFFLYVLYDGVLGFILIRRFLRLRKVSPKVYAQVWPIHVGIIFFIIHTDFMALMILIRPLQRPTIWLNSIVFTSMILVYLFKQVKKNLSFRENMYFNYIYDELTTVHSRSYILEMIDSTRLSRAKHDTYVAMIDIDGFKSVNDNLGHLEGDHLLRSFGQMIKTMDPDHIHCGRLGGDEFILLSENLSQDKLLEALDRLLDQFQHLVEKLTEHQTESEILTGLSIGVHRLAPTDTIKDILIKADHGMYNAKNSGKNKYTIAN